MNLIIFFIVLANIFAIETPLKTRISILVSQLSQNIQLINNNDGTFDVNIPVSPFNTFTQELELKKTVTDIGGGNFKKERLTVSIGLNSNSCLFNKTANMLDLEYYHNITKYDIFIQEGGDSMKSRYKSDHLNISVTKSPTFYESEYESEIFGCVGLQLKVNKKYSDPSDGDIFSKIVIIIWTICIVVWGFVIIRILKNK